MTEKTEYWGDRWGIFSFGKKKPKDRSAKLGPSLSAAVLERI